MRMKYASAIPCSGFSNFHRNAQFALAKSTLLCLVRFHTSAHGWAMFGTICHPWAATRMTIRRIPAIP